jgi:hypothetical protein
MTKPVYLFDPLTGILTDAYQAQESPAEPGVFITPTYSTAITPPLLADNQAAIFSTVTNKWTVVPDFRGETFYNQTTGAAVLIEAIGAVAANLGASPPPKSLAEIKAIQTARINDSASMAFSAITSAYPRDEIETWPNQLWDALAYQKNPLDNLVILPQIAASAGITVAELAARVLTLAAQFNDTSGAIIGKRKAKHKAIELALTVAEVEAIVW